MSKSEKIYYVYNSSLAHKGRLYHPGSRVDVAEISAEDIKSLRKSGVLISAAEKRSLEEAARLTADRLKGTWVVGSGEKDYTPEPTMAPKPMGNLTAAIEDIRANRGEEPERVMEEPVFEDAPDPEDDVYDDEDEE